MEDGSKILNIKLNAQSSSSANFVATSVAENVSSFLNGIHATFRQDNVTVSSSIRPKKVVSRGQIDDESARVHSKNPSLPNE